MKMAQHQKYKVSFLTYIDDDEWPVLLEELESRNITVEDESYAEDRVLIISSGMRMSEVERAVSASCWDTAFDIDTWE